MRIYLQRLKDDAGVTWRELEAATGISAKTLRTLAAGEARQVRLDYLDALCTYFGLASLDDLMTPNPIVVPVGRVRGEGAGDD